MLNYRVIILKKNKNLQSKKGIELRKRHGNGVESVFGEVKLNKSKQRYLLQGIEKVNIKAGIYYLTYNIRKIHPQSFKKPNKQDQLKEKPSRINTFFQNRILNDDFLDNPTCNIT